MCCLRPFPLFCTYFSLRQPGFFKKNAPLALLSIVLPPKLPETAEHKPHAGRKGGKQREGVNKGSLTAPAAQRVRAVAAARASPQRRKGKTGIVAPAVAGGA